MKLFPRVSDGSRTSLSDSFDYSVLARLLPVCDRQGTNWFARQGEGRRASRCLLYFALNRLTSSGLSELTDSCSSSA